MGSKRGSSTVFLVFILAAMVGLAAAFVYMAKKTAYTSIADGAVSLAMRSVMAEYQVELKNRYGIMAFDKSGMDAALEINDYIDYTLQHEKPVKKLEVQYAGYSLADPKVLKKQILDYMEYMAMEGLLEQEESVPVTEYHDRTLRNKAILETLPSKPYDDLGESILDKGEKIVNDINSVDDIFDNTTESYLLDSYILMYFKHAAGGPLEQGSFFQNEVEYILAGDTSNEKNREKVRAGLKILRTAMNSAYLYADKERRAQTLAAAELLTPGSGAVTQAVIIATWASAEAENDVRLLLDGKKVPFVKNDSSWATDLDNVLNNIEKDYIDTGNESGMSYDGYLMVFLHFQDETIKLMRIADLIQINMKGTEDRDFLMKTSNGGMSLKAEFYGKERTYETTY